MLGVLDSGPGPFSPALVAVLLHGSEFPHILVDEERGLFDDIGVLEELLHGLEQIQSVRLRVAVVPDLLSYLVELLLGVQVLSPGIPNFLLLRRSDLWDFFGLLSSAATAESVSHELREPFLAGDLSRNVGLPLEVSLQLPDLLKLVRRL